MQINILKSAQPTAFLLAAAISLVSFPISANTNIGQVIFSTGNVRAVNDGEARVLRRGSKIQEGDVIKSSRFSRSQIRMKDGALIAVRPGSEFGFNQYRYDEKDSSNNSSILNLVKGGFRTISGLIGKVFKQNYKVKTAMATIGIRGTHYGLTICQQGDCNTDGNSEIADGLYGSVIDGEVSAKNDTGEFVFSNDEFFHVESLGSQPRGLIKPPGVIFAQYESEEALKKADNLKKAATSQIARLLQQANVTGTLATTNELLVKHIRANFETTEDIDLEQVISALNVTVPGTTTAASPGQVMSVSYFGQGGSDSSTGLNPATNTITSDGTANNEFLLNSTALSNGMLEPVAAVSTDNNGAQHAFALASASIVEPQTAFVPNTTVKVGWGRWSTQYTSTVNSVIEPHVGQLHYLVATDVTTSVELSQLGGLIGSGTYASTGGTKATDLTGNIAATHATVSMMVDFRALSIDSFNIDTVVNGINYAAGASSVSINNAINNGLILSGAGQCSTCTGQASLAFYGPQAEGAGTVYTIQDGATNAVNGASVMDNLTPFAP